MSCFIETQPNYGFSWDYYLYDHCAALQLLSTPLNTVLGDSWKQGLAGQFVPGRRHPGYRRSPNRWNDSRWGPEQDKRLY